MKFKPVPEPPTDPGTLGDARRAVPLVPATEADCLHRLQRRLGLESRADARAWLTLLRALGLVARTDGGYVRTRGDPDTEALAATFQERVYLADALAAALDADPLTASAAFESVVAPAVPTWERHRSAGGWRDDWRDRTRRVLGWLALFGVAARTGGGYVRVE